MNFCWREICSSFDISSKTQLKIVSGFFEVKALSKSLRDYFLLSSRPQLLTKLPRKGSKCCDILKCRTFSELSPGDKLLFLMSFNAASNPFCCYGFGESNKSPTGQSWKFSIGKFFCVNLFQLAAFFFNEDLIVFSSEGFLGGRAKSFFVVTYDEKQSRLYRNKFLSRWKVYFWLCEKEEEKLETFH